MNNQNKNNKQTVTPLYVRLSPSRRAMVDYIAEKEEKSLTRVIEEAIDSYIRPKYKEYRR